MRGQAQGDVGLAIADLTRAIELNPEASRAYYLRGSLFKKRQDYDRARWHSTAIEHDPKSASVYSARAGVYAKKGDRSERKLTTTPPCALTSGTCPLP